MIELTRKLKIKLCILVITSSILLPLFVYTLIEEEERDADRHPSMGYFTLWLLIMIGLFIKSKDIFSKRRRTRTKQGSSRRSSWKRDTGSRDKHMLHNLKKQQVKKEQKHKEEIKQMKSKFSELDKKLKNITPKEMEVKDIKKNIFQNFPSRSDLNDNFSKLSPIEMEELTGVLFEKKGYSVEVTKPSGDYGIDVWATGENEKIGIQVKKWAGDVGFDDVSKTLGSNLGKANRYIIISTTSFFSKPAQNWQKEIPHMIELWDTNRFKEELQEHDVVVE